MLHHEVRVYSLLQAGVMAPELPPMSIPESPWSMPLMSMLKVVCVSRVVMEVCLMLGVTPQL